MQTWRFVVRLNRSLVELVGLVIEKTEVVYLKLFPCVIIEKDISSHLRSCKFSDPENEVDLICRVPASSKRQKISMILQISLLIDQISVLSGVVVPIVDVG